MANKNQCDYYSKSPLKLNHVLFIILNLIPIFLQYLMKAQYVIGFYVNIITEDLQLFHLCVWN